MLQINIESRKPYKNFCMGARSNDDNNDTYLLQFLLHPRSDFRTDWIMFLEVILSFDLVQFHIFAYEICRSKQNLRQFRLDKIEATNLKSRERDSSKSHRWTVGPSVSNNLIFWRIKRKAHLSYCLCPTFILPLPSVCCCRINDCLFLHQQDRTCSTKRRPIPGDIRSNSSF